MFDNGLTSFDTVASFRYNDQITRWEVAKFFNEFAELIGKEKSRASSECQFGDIEGYDYTLVPQILEACERALVQGSQWNYMPNRNMTEAEALTVVIRTVLGQQDESGAIRWSETYNAAKWLWLLDNETVEELDRPVTRGKVGTWLYRASQVDIETANQEGSDQLKEILSEVFGEEFWDDM
jgi:hypothetical protein